MYSEQETKRMDLVTRLREAADTSANGGGQWFQLVHRCRDAADEIERLRAFAKAILQHCFDGGEGGDVIQEEALKHGLLTPTTYDPKIHGEHDFAEPGGAFFVYSDWLKDS